ncbi:MAG: hypothetical protein ACK5IC_06335, partial [Moheibacter sp.]
SYHNRNCIGGNGFCSGSVVTGSTEKTTASVQKIATNLLQVTLEKAGFSSKQWEELTATKTFPVDNGTNVTLDNELLTTLGINERYNTLKPKNYPVVINRETVVFVLELETQK